MGRKITIPGVTFSDATLPKLPEYDQIESSGSLFLFEPAHSLGLVSGVPGAGAALPNIVWPKAAAILGGGTQSSLAGTVSDRSPDDSIWRVERTAKGGVHGITTQGGSQANNRSWVGQVPAAVRDYIRLNVPGRKFYFSIWTRLTRTTIPNVAAQSLFHCAPSTSNLLFHTQGGGQFVSGSEFVQHPTAGADDFSLGVNPNRLIAGSVSAVTGSGVSAGQPVEFLLGTGAAWGSFNFNKAPSRVIYRVYIEDLTTSGRSFATISALDKALFDAAFATGGRYNNDTFTAPSTIP